MDLPAGLATRPLTIDDLTEVFEVYAAAERADAGALMLEPEDIEGEWARPSFDLATQSIGVFEDGRLIGSAEVFGGRRADAAVLPEHTGRGIGSWLLDWTEQVARRDGEGTVGQTRFAGCLGEKLLISRGYDLLWTTWVLQLPADTRIAEPPLPQGYSLRAVVPGADDRAVYQLIEDAFNEWPNRTPQSFEDWYPRMLGRRGFEPWQILLAVDADDTPVGAALTIIDAEGEAYIDQLAVRKDQRGQGLATSLMAGAFRIGREKGATSYGLSTDSRTGALGLYEKVGMQVTQIWHQRARTLD